jgi:uncharacterized cofD-like protein
MNITCIGGGTGSTVVLQGLKKYRDLKLNVIVGMMDDGGSNAVIRDEFGLLPLSDLRKSIIALADDSDNYFLRELFTYRFSNGEGMKGHTLGNLLMIAATDILENESEAIEYFKTMFNVKGEILPVTFDDVKLVAEYADGSKSVGEHLIDEPEVHKDIVNFYLDSKSVANPDAVKSILESDYIVIGPGDLYTTTLQSIIVPGIAEALQKTKGKIIFITNLMSKKGQTRNRTQKELVEILEKYIGKKVDSVFVNNGEIPEDAYQRYVNEGEHLLTDDLHDGYGRKIIRKDLVANDLIKQEKGDGLKRSFVRHDSEKLSKELYAIFRGSFLRRFFEGIFSHYMD